MTENEIIEKITPLFRDIFAEPDLLVHAGLTAEQVERWDSLSNVNLIMSIERTFSIRFALGELKKLQNVGEMIRLIQEKI